MLPEHFYLTGAGLLGYLLYAPLVVFLLVLLHRHLLRRLLGPVPRWGTSLVLAVVLLSLPFWDVLAIGRQADKLCREQGGLHVYKTVEAEGFLGAESIKYWSKYGFKYVDIGGKGGWSRVTLRNGKAFYKSIPESRLSRYTWGTVENHVPVTKWIARSSDKVIDRKTGEVLGELVTFSIYPGWFDRLFLGVLPVEFNPWICGRAVPAEQRKMYGKYYYSDDLIKAVIKPR